jgi:hypothetical protein
MSDNRTFGAECPRAARPPLEKSSRFDQVSNDGGARDFQTGVVRSGLPTQGRGRARRYDLHMNPPSIRWLRQFQDVYGANLLFEIPGLDVATEEDILFDVHTPVESELVLRVDGHCPDGGDPWAPRRLLLTQPLRGTKAASRVDLREPIIKFTDFGGGWYSFPSAVSDACLL